jgi:hypothetical protein
MPHFIELKLTLLNETHYIQAAWTLSRHQEHNLPAPSGKAPLWSSQLSTSDAQQGT